MIISVKCVRKGSYLKLIMWVGFILAGVCLFCYVTTGTSDPGTTLNIQEIFIGRCWEYLEIRSSQLSGPSGTNCTELWTTFSGAWIHKDPTTIKAIDYQSFFNAVKQPGIEKMLLWSGTYDIAHEYSRHVSYYVTLEDSFLGYIVNSLKWCGVVCSNCRGIDYKSCPDLMHNEAGRAFWGGASKTFASSLKEGGLVQLMLNGSNSQRPAFNPNSYFSLYELPSLPKSASLLVILVHDIGKPVVERCTTGSLIQLKSRVESFNFKFDCVENPTAVVHLLCADIPLNKECILQTETVSNCAQRTATSIVVCLLLYMVFMYSIY